MYSHQENKFIMSKESHFKKKLQLENIEENNLTYAVFVKMSHQIDLKI